MYPFPEGTLGFPGGPCSNGLGSQTPGSNSDSLSPETAAAVAAVVRQQIQMAAAAQHHSDVSNFNLPAHLHSANGGSANNIPMPKLSSPAAPGQLTNSGGSGVSIPRLASPAIPGMPNSMHGLSGLSGLHLMQGLSGNNNVSNLSGQTSQSSGVTITPAHSGTSGGGNGSVNTSNSTSQSLSNALAHLPSATTLSSGSLNISQIGSPTGSIHDLRITSPDENRINSPMDSLESAGVNLATYKSSSTRNYSSPSSRSELFADELNDFMNSRASRYKDSTTGIKIEPLAECRGD